MPSQRRTDMYSTRGAVILDQVRFILSYQLCLPLDGIVGSANLEDELGMDRLDFAEMCIALEDAFDIEIDETRRFRTVFEVAAFLGKRILPRSANDYVPASSDKTRSSSG